MKRRAAGETRFQNKPLTIYPFDDSDLYKAVEGASFALSLQKNPPLEAKLDGYIAKFAAAQEPDGYLYTFRTMHPDSPAHDWVDQQRWLKDPILSHELYNLGHLYEAGVAHYQATGKRNLLVFCLRSAPFTTGFPAGCPSRATVSFIPTRWSTMGKRSITTVMPGAPRGSAAPAARRISCAPWRR